MVKKRKTSHKKLEKKIIHSSLNEEDARTEKILIENFVALQKVMTHLSERFDNLSSQISKMLNLFEISAKALAEKDFGAEKEEKELKKVADKLDGLLEQNKVIARGLTLLHEEASPTRKPEMQQEAPNFIQPPRPMQNVSREKYQKSISSGESSLSQAQSSQKDKPITR